jgi:transposase
VTDVADAAWIAQLVEHGLIRPSFVPPKPIRELRELTRYRKALIHERTREVQRLHKLLEDTGIKLGCVASDVLGVSGRAMLEALVGGTTDPGCWPSWPAGACAISYRRCARRLRAGSPTITGCWSLNCWHTSTTWTRPSSGSAGSRAGGRPFSPLLALLCTIPGVDRRTAEVILAEIGTDMARFPTAGHLASWAGLCPGNNESTGKHHARHDPQGVQVAADRAGPGRQRRRPDQGDLSCGAVCQAQGAAGHKKAIVAVAHSILVICWHLLACNEPYDELGGDYFLERQSSQAYKHRLVRQLERMGYQVTPEPADAA